MRLKNISNIEEANRYLKNEYIDKHNKKFSLEIIINDIHRKLDNTITIDDVCYMEKARKLNNDWTISYENQWYQLKKQSQYNPPAKSTVFVRKTINGKVEVFYRNRPIEYKMLE